MNDFSRRYHLRRENGSAEARRKRGGRSAEANRFRGKRAEARGSVAEGSPKQLVQTLTGVPTELFEIDIYAYRVPPTPKLPAPIEFYLYFYLSNATYTYHILPSRALL